LGPSRLAHCSASMPLLAAHPPSTTACTAAQVWALWQREQVLEF
jgi:hypothetical protein